ncbi:MAG TPA: TrmH family RNA methyltransferase [Patescibacteria group bacterium]
MRKLSTGELVAKKPKIEEFLKQKRNPVYVVLNNIRSLENVGLIFRLCDALLVEKLYLTGITGYPALGKKDSRPKEIISHAEKEITKTAIWTIDYVPWEYQKDAVGLIENLKKKGVQIIALEQTDRSKPYNKISPNFPVCIVLGHEREGIENPVLKLADEIIEIPIYGMGNSLNVATSLAIVGYHYIWQV